MCTHMNFIRVYMFIYIYKYIYTYTPRHIPPYVFKYRYTCIYGGPLYIYVLTLYINTAIIILIYMYIHMFYKPLYTFRLTHIHLFHVTLILVSNFTRPAHNKAF